MTTTTEPTTLSPYQERHRLQADMQAARVAAETVRGQLAQLAGERKRAEAEAFKQEMEIVVGTEGAAELRDAALERLRGIENTEPQYRRSLQAAEELVRIRQAQLEILYESDDGFTAFCREAESATAGAIRDLQELRAAAARASKSWAKASALWRPLNAGLRHRLEELNDREGVHANVPPQAAVAPFPVSFPSDLSTLAPRPSGVARLPRAQPSA